MWLVKKNETGCKCEYANFSRENLDSEFQVGDDNAQEMQEWLYDTGDNMSTMTKHIKDIKSGMYR